MLLIAPPALEEAAVARPVKPEPVARPVKPERRGVRQVAQSRASDAGRCHVPAALNPGAHRAARGWSAPAP